MALTDLQVRRAKPKEKKYRMYDEGGLYVEVRPNGGKYWYLKYRLNNKEKYLMLGRYPDVSVAEAHAERDKARKLVKEGRDPYEAKLAAKQAQLDKLENTFEAVTLDWYETYKKNVTTATAKDTLSRINLYLLPTLGKRPINEITALDFTKVLQKIESAIQANHCKRICNRILRYAVSLGKTEANPVANLDDILPKHKGKHYKSVTDPNALSDILKKIDSVKGKKTPVIYAAMRLLPMLFVRPNELCTMRWADVDLDGGKWCYTISKTDTPHIVPLAKQAIAILKELQPITGGKEYVFYMANKLGYIYKEVLGKSFNSCLSGVISPHGFRATARTILDEVLGYRVAVIDKQLGHAVKDTNGEAYNRTQFIEERKKMMQYWADYLEGKKEGGKIIPFKTA